MNLALADIRHKLGRFLLTCVGRGLLMGVALSMVGIYQGVVAEALALSRALDADLWVVESGTRGPFAEASRLPGDVRAMVRRLPGVAEAGGITLRIAEAEAPQGRLRMQLIGYEPGLPGGPSAIAQGRGLGGARYEMVADQRARNLKPDAGQHPRFDRPQAEHSHWHVLGDAGHHHRQGPLRDPPPARANPDGRDDDGNRDAKAHWRGVPEPGWRTIGSSAPRAENYVDAGQSPPIHHHRRPPIPPCPQPPHRP